MNRTKSFRREREKISKIRAYRKIKQNWMFNDDFNERQIGLMASTHCKPCSCYMCGNPRKYENEKTVTEMKSDDSFHEQIDKMIF